MKIRNILCGVLCTLLISTVAYAQENEQANEPQEKGLPTAENMPEENMPPYFSENGENAVPGGMRRGGRGGFGRGPVDGNMEQGGFGARGDFGGEMAENPMQNTEEAPQSEVQQNRYNITYISSAVLLIFGFIFAMLYKRRTF